jgi:hypothetical protein
MRKIVRKLYNSHIAKHDKNNVCSFQAFKKRIASWRSEKKAIDTPNKWKWWARNVKWYKRTREKNYSDVVTLQTFYFHISNEWFKNACKKMDKRLNNKKNLQDTAG